MTSPLAASTTAAATAAMGTGPAFCGRVLDDDAGLILTHRILVTRICNPLLEQPWGTARFSAREVHAALRASTTSAAPGDMVGCGEHGDPAVRAASEPLERTECQACEVARVAGLAAALRSLPTPQDVEEAHGLAHALLALHPEPHPITVDVGLGPYWAPWLLADGNHRVAAATAVNWPWLVVAVAGDWDRAVRLFVDGFTLGDVLAEEW